MAMTVFKSEKYFSETCFYSFSDVEPASFSTFIKRNGGFTRLFWLKKRPKGVSPQRLKILISYFILQGLQHGLIRINFCIQFAL